MNQLWPPCHGCFRHGAGGFPPLYHTYQSGRGRAAALAARGFYDVSMHMYEYVARQIFFGFLLDGGHSRPTFRPVRSVLQPFVLKMFSPVVLYHFSLFSSM